MQFRKDFKFLNLQVIKKKNASDLPEDERAFLKVNFLDEENNPCSFFVFDKEIITRILSAKYTPLSSISIDFELNYSNDKWLVKLVDVHD